MEIPYMRALAAPTGTSSAATTANGIDLDQMGSSGTESSPTSISFSSDLN
jgi:hypothetical protein